ncbi:homoprotocatechuate degradation operon regulator HpaR [Bradyrhizobium sp. LHD-71]|uniref:homoprotocatechuate degradation operon regulator HpaR n=1 Tax=Bradyrhizobium sp. LHD-71 TaxID=3072141 RepID=UPI00280C56E1|nr:homoprotocatechuate degradation operon regulator HpaR [Bradyrhizobium sp. LHD-71]MDQ8729226.1 homoprotocatechuate degradation operon regulator HpaR [Bradyrhizobium sp. LHD-71]
MRTRLKTRKAEDRSPRKGAAQKKRIRRLPASTERSQHGLMQEAIPETALPVALLRAREAVMFHMRPILREHGFTEQQWRVLRKLDPAVPIDKTTLSFRATLLMPSLLRILKDLEEIELIRLVSSERNPRLFRVVLSAKGATAVARTSADIERAGKAVKARIGEESVVQLIELLQTVETRLTGFSLP